MPPSEKNLTWPMRSRSLPKPVFQAQADDVVQAISGQGDPGSKVKATLPVQPLEGSEGVGAVLVSHQPNVVDAGNPPTMKGAGGIFKGIHDPIGIGRGQRRRAQG